jgi:hypothetical protein
MKFIDQLRGRSQLVIEGHYPDAKKNGTPASPATALASIVLPVPGGL